MDTLAFEKQFKPIYPSLVGQITEFLTNAIVECQLHSGQRLVESEIQRKFMVSRAPIREAFRILEANGLVTTIPRKGTFVRIATPKYIEETLSVRAILEAYAARLAISNLQVEDVARMKSALSKMTKALNNKDFKSYFIYHKQFHDVFIHASKNETLIEIIENLKNRSIWFTNTYMARSVVEDSSKHHVQAHREIIDAFIEKDAVCVEARVKKHILQALERFQEVFSKIEKIEENCAHPNKSAFST